MSHTPHELAEEFPDQLDKLQALKSEAHFSKLADEYHDINREIHRIETNVEPASPVHEEGLRKKRMVLKDEIAKMLRES